MNELTDLFGYAGNKTDVAGTFTSDNIESVTVTNNTTSEEYTAQLRGETLYVARAVELDSGSNEIEAVAIDPVGQDSDTITVTLDDEPDIDYTYDDAGCLTSDGTYTYEYDYEHRLVKVKEGQTTVAAFEYDALGRRVKKTVGDDVTRYIYDGENVVEEYVLDESGWVLDGEYVHGIGIDDVLTIERDSSRWYYHHDGLGSVTELTDSDGALAQAYEYDAWGTPTIYNPQSPIRNPYLYTGREWDADIALYYYRARHYAPLLGRFLQPDPAGYHDGPNLYTYVRSAPTRFVDWDGRQAKGDEVRDVWEKQKVLDILCKTDRGRKVVKILNRSNVYRVDYIKYWLRTREKPTDKWGDYVERRSDGLFRSPANIYARRDLSNEGAASTLSHEAAHRDGLSSEVDAFTVETLLAIESDIPPPSDDWVKKDESGERVPDVEQIEKDVGEIPEYEAEKDKPPTERLVEYKQNEDGTKKIEMGKQNLVTGWKCPVQEQKQKADCSTSTP